VRLDDCAFETSRLSVADWHSQTDGVETLVEVVCDMLTADVTEQLPTSWQGPYSAERAAAWISDRDADGILLLAIRADTREPVGLLMLHEDESSRVGRSDVRLGYLVTQGQWGRGFASEMLGGLIDWARVSGVASLVAGVAHSNDASIRVLDKCGLTRVDGERPGGSEYLYRMDL
jgi:RimJ/RimL family protein N-acetyltransferase